MNLGLNLSLRGARPTLAQQVSQIFKLEGLTGGWFDSGDALTAPWYQDSAGTTAAAIEQPLGKAIDKSGNGNHALQATAAARPKLSSRVNLLTKSEQFDGSAWTKSNSSVSVDAVAAPLGTITADKIVENSASSEHYAGYEALAKAASVTCTLTVYAKAAERTRLTVNFRGGTVSDGAEVTANLAAGTLGTASVSGGMTSPSASITDVGGGWYRCSLTATTDSGTVLSSRLKLHNGSSVNYVGDGASGAYVWGVQLELGSVATRYQRVDTASSYDTAGFPLYTLFDAVPDDYLTSATGGGGNTGFCLAASVKPSKNGVTRILYSDIGTNTGFQVTLLSTNVIRLAAGNGSAFLVCDSANTLLEGVPNTVLVWFDGTNLNVQLNGGTVSVLAAPGILAGPGGFTLGRNQSSGVANMQGGFYSVIFTKNSGLTSVQRAILARYIAQKAGL